MIAWLRDRGRGGRRGAEVVYTVGVGVGVWVTSRLFYELRARVRWYAYTW